MYYIFIENDKLKKTPNKIIFEYEYNMILLYIYTVYKLQVGYMY